MVLVEENELRSLGNEVRTCAYGHRCASPRAHTPLLPCCSQSPSSPAAFLPKVSFTVITLTTAVTATQVTDAYAVNYLILRATWFDGVPISQMGKLRFREVKDMPMMTQCIGATVHAPSPGMGHTLPEMLFGTRQGINKEKNQVWGSVCIRFLAQLGPSNSCPRGPLKSTQRRHRSFLCPATRTSPGGEAQPSPPA